MRIGFDIDGVFANFVASYRVWLVQQTGKDLFPPSPLSRWDSWDWDLEVGYTNEERGRTFKAIAESPSFWYGLEPHLDSTETMWMLLHELEHKHDIYFVTNRAGETAKRQTEAWLLKLLPYYKLALSPTVLISSHKGLVAAALKLDCYVDDNLDNILSVLSESPKTRAYLLNRAYNAGNATIRFGEPNERVATRINTLGEMFDAELARL
jgi:5'(3')-deoxyribonucleotidase